jgi:hypothetical protein
MGVLRLSCETFIWRAVCALLSFGICFSAEPTAGRLSVQERQIDGETVVAVETGFYEFVVRPRSGACVSDFSAGRRELIQLTSWKPGEPSGLLQEAHTADREFALIRRDVSAQAAVLEFEADAPQFVLVKRFELRADRPVFKVALICRNKTPFALGGTDAPALENLLLPGGGKPSGREYYCLDCAGNARALTAATVLRDLSPLRAANGPLRWLTVTDAVSQKGIGFVFLDAGAHSPSAFRRADGAIAVQWRCASVPGYSTLRTEFLIAPLDGFAAVSGMGEAFAADCVPSRNAEGKTVVSLRLTALEGDLDDVSVVTRAHRRDGSEIGPWETLQFERVPRWTSVVGEIAPPDGASETAWLQHQVYSRGKRIGELRSRLAADAALASNGNEQSLPVPAVEVQGGTGDEPTDAERIRGFTVRRFAGGAKGVSAGPVRIALTKGEKETLVFAVRALVPIDKLMVTTMPLANLEAGFAALPAAATFLWSVEQVNGAASLVPFADRKLSEGELAWVAVTVDAGQLERGAYACSLLFQGGGEPAEVVLQTVISTQTLEGRSAFALAYVDGGEPAENWTSALSWLRSCSVSGVILPLGRDAGVAAVSGALRAAEAARMDFAVFHTFGGVELAELLSRAGLPCSVSMPCPVPRWLLVADIDSPDDAASLAKSGFGSSVLSTDLKPDSPWNRSALSQWMLAEGVGQSELGNLMRDGPVKLRNCAWLYLDVTGMDWRRAAVEVRRSAWAAAWQGLAGMAVRSERPGGKTDGQPLIWHILRDAREEAALVALSSKSGGLDAVVGEPPTGLVAMREEKIPFRQILRAVPKNAEAPLLSFEEAKMRLLAHFDTLPAPHVAASSNVNWSWNGATLMRDDAVRWVIVAACTEAKPAAERLRAAFRNRTGKEVPLSATFPTVVEGIAVPTLVWYVRGPNAEGLPEALRPAALALEDGGLRFVNVNGVPTVMVGRAVDSEALARALQPEAQVP